MTGTENIISKTAAPTHHNRQIWQIILVQQGRTPTDQRSSRSGIQRVKDPGDRCIEIRPEEQFRRWGVARFPFSCTSCLSPVKLRRLVAAVTRYSRPLSLLVQPVKWWTNVRHSKRRKDGSVMETNCVEWRESNSQMGEIFLSKCCCSRC